MQAIILAAGMGRRLGKVTADNTKCMVKIHDLTLIERMLDILAKTEVSRVILVVGYKSKNVKNLVGRKYKGMQIHYVTNEVYDKTNNIYSLFLAKKYLLEDDTILIESDLIFEEKIIFDLIENPHPNLAIVAKYDAWMDGTVVTLDDDDNIVQFIPKKDFDYSQVETYYKTVNIYKLSCKFSSNSYVPFLKAYQQALGKNEYYEQVLRVITLLETQDLKVHRLSTEKWYEIDDQKDLNNASTLFAPEGKRLGLYQKRFGGYWRFPFLKDFCYLVNPYFPPRRMLDEMRYHYRSLLTEYPSGLSIQNLMASEMFACDAGEIIVGNGATELINALFDFVTGNVGVIFPTFNEYPERIGNDNLVQFIPDNADYSYNLQDLKQFSKQVNTLLLINPDNPSGHYLSTENVHLLASHLNKKKKRLILDESFVDFTTDGAQNSLISSDVLQRHPNLIVIKSISKSYGVPGLRLGVIATSDTNLIASIRERISIWNINSFGEFFLQIFGKYQSDYNLASVQIAEERNRFFLQLKKIKFLRVIPSQSNYFLCELMHKYTATELTTLLLEEYEVLIKDCTGKTGFEGRNYVRIAVRDKEDNDFLLKQLKAL
ncbi:MAG: aminotransferase class I/II-fold pyridoxal phosphate-dependent enzyme [Gammaproteobacteria bacterium]|nr:aminotransferase class I/II-fold pyridoxal phosphate-dependent enzyme [Gammaproteobacteria bacterium]